MKQKFNPWLEIWTRPRATIRRIVDERPNRSIWLLAAIYGFGSLMSNAQSLVLGRSLNLFAIFLIALVLSPIWGYVFFSLWSAVVYWVGKIFKGSGSFQTVRAAYSWSCVPLVVNVPMWFLLAFAFGSQLFDGSSGADGFSGPWFFLLFCALIIRLIMAVWSLVIYFNALAEVQTYSILKAILNIVVAALLFLAAGWVVWTIASLLS